MLRYYIIFMAFLSAPELQATSTKPDQSKKVRLVTGEWCPYFSSSFKENGVFSRIVVQAFKKEGYQAQIEFKPWTRVYHEVKNGSYDGSLGWTRTPNREKIFHFSDPILDQEQVFFHLKATRFDWKRLLDLKPYSIGLTRSFAYTEELLSMVRSGKLKGEFIASDQNNMRKLSEKRVDLFPVAHEVGYCYVKTILTTEKQPLITHHKRPLKVSHLHGIFPKKNQKSVELVKALNRGLDKLRKDSEFEDILNDSEFKNYSKWTCDWLDQHWSFKPDLFD
ncbi:substrate-binding periplasmic protein [Pseudobacteriovorax antillogorgiicola]|nr:transporter substrate-binding domain-containing protein [Pseudobacteriovorax antillogorgiicola]